MEDKIKVLMADDSAVVRRILKDVFGEFEELQVVHAARDGSEAVGAFSKCEPDVVVLDVEMPEMNGLEAAKAINQLNPDVPIIMFSSITTKGAEITLDALANGASDYETKPSMVGHLDEARAHVRERLIPKVITWGGKKRTENGSQELDNSDPALCTTQLTMNDWQKSKPEVLVVGSSTGGPDALKDFLAQFPESFDMPILIAQHMPAVFTKIMADRLNSSSKISVSEATEGMKLEPGKAVVAPGDYHLTIGRSGIFHVCDLDQEEPVNFCRPSVDVLFNSAVKQFGGHVLAVILTGMGKDGLDGATAIKEKGGIVMAQDKVSSSVWGMPGAVCEAGLATVIGTPKTLAQNVLNVKELISQPAKC